jgi:hypothetical protein
MAEATAAGAQTVRQIASWKLSDWNIRCPGLEP